MQKITPFLWFNDNAEEAVNFYISLFENSKIQVIQRYGNEVPEMKDKILTAVFQLEGQSFMALDGGPMYSFTPAVSFMVNCKTVEEVDRLWKKLAEGGMVLMELGKYPFSEKYGWVQDRFGLSWQLSVSQSDQKITPSLLFVGDQYAKAEEAMTFYIAQFNNSGIQTIMRYQTDSGEKEGSIQFALFKLDGQSFAAMDSGYKHAFTFTGAVSFFVNCENQEEIDKLWENLSRNGKQLQCGWLEDEFGVTWQVIPRILGEMMQDKDRERANRVMQAMMQMQKIDIKKLQEAYGK